MEDGNLRLCYIKGDNHAYFTSQPLEDQWGDDWDDAPYEHNAGEPYEPYERRDASDYGDGKPRWRIVSCFFECDLVTPSWACVNSSYSVETINAGAIPWLRPMEGFDGPSIPAGTTLDEFRRLIAIAGGKVYLESPSLYKGRADDCATAPLVFLTEFLNKFYVDRCECWRVSEDRQAIEGRRGRIAINEAAEMCSGRLKEIELWPNG